MWLLTIFFSLFFYIDAKHMELHEESVSCFVFGGELTNLACWTVKVTPYLYLVAPFPSSLSHFLF